MKVTDPVIAVEVLSTSSRAVDFGRKQEGYLDMPSLRHDRVVTSESRKITHFRRQADGTFLASIHAEGPLTSTRSASPSTACSCDRRTPNVSTSTTTELPRMDAGTFIVWSVEQPEGEHYELHDGVVVRMPNEGALHGETKSIVSARFVMAVPDAGMNGQVFMGEMAVNFGRGLVLNPDVVVRFGDRLPSRVARVLEPAIDVEVLSPSRQRVDFGIKLDAYLGVPSLQHYLIIDPERRRIIHHRRGENETFLTTMHGDGPLTLDPPGITIDRLFP